MKFGRISLLIVLMLLLVSVGVQASPTEITFVTLEDLIVNLEPVVRAFEQLHPDIRVKLEGYPFNNLLEVIETKMGAQARDIDVFNVDVPLVANYTIKGFLEPLDPFYDQAELEEYLESALQGGSFQGSFTAAPLNSSSVGLYVNLDLFAEYGVEPPSLDPSERWTWEQVLEVAAELTIDRDNNGQIDIWGFAIDQFSRPYQMLPFVQSLGGEAISADGLQSTGYVNSPVWVEVAQFYQDLFHVHRVSPLGVPTFQPPELFKAGTIAMLLTGPWHVNSFNQVDGLNWLYAPHPYFAEGVPVTPTGSWHVGVSKNSANKEAAAEFVKFLTLSEGNQIYFDGDGNLPANVHTLAYASERAAAADNAVMELAIYEAANTAVPRPSTPGYLEWEIIITQAFEDIRNGADPQTTLDQAAARIDRELRKYTR